MGEIYLRNANFVEAEKWFRKVIAYDGVGKAQFVAWCNLGYMCLKGLGKDKPNYTEAERWYKRVEEQGRYSEDLKDCVAWARCHLGLILYKGYGMPKSRPYAQAYTWAKELFNKAVDGGNADAQYYLGRISEKYGDYRGAEQFYLKAMENKDKGFIAKAKYRLGKLHEMGKGVSQDYGRALFLYKEAADMGYAKAQCSVGDLYKIGKPPIIIQDLVEAALWYQKAGDQGYPWAQCHLGEIYREDKKFREAKALFDRVIAHEGENAAKSMAQCNLGYMYLKGRITKDDRLAEHWYRQAEELDHNPWAQCHLGLMCCKEAPPNYKQALVWFEKAALQGNAEAKYRLGVLYENGLGVVRNDSEALKFYNQAADQNYAKAQYKMGTLYEHGQLGLVQDRKKAREFYEAAKRAGSKRAKLKL